MTKHKTPWILVGEQTVAFDDDVWELYDTTKDWSQAKDLAKEMPEKLHELQRLWLIEATRYNVLPLDDDTASRINPDLAGRPVLIRGNTQVLFSNMGRLSENCVLNLKNKSHTVTAEVEVPETGAEGVIVAQGAASAAGACMPTTASSSTATTWVVSSTSTPSPPTRCRPAPIRCAWNSLMPVAVWARAAR